MYYNNYDWLVSLGELEKNAVSYICLHVQIYLHIPTHTYSLVQYTCVLKDLKAVAIR